MPNASRRADSSHEQFNQRVPKDVVERLRGSKVAFTFPPMNGDPEHATTVTLGTFVKFSLRTRDPVVAAARNALAVTRLAPVYDAVRNGPRPLTWYQLVALSGEAYRLYVERFGEDPGDDPDVWRAFKGVNRAVIEGRVPDAPAMSLGEIPVRDLQHARHQFGRDLTAAIDALPREKHNAAEIRFGGVADEILSMHGVQLVADDRRKFLFMIANAANKAGLYLRQASRFDYDPKHGAHFPAIELTARSTVTLTEIFNRWKTETKPSASTLKSWGGIVRAFQARFEGKSIASITPEDIVAWKDELLSGPKPLHLKTVKDGHLTAMRSLFTYAVTNHMLTTNPVASVKIRLKRKAGENKLGYTDEQVRRLLQIAAQETHPARRWLIPLAAFSGSRIGEVAQLWGGRVTVVDGVAVMKIMSAEDAGSVKNEVAERDVPIHPYLLKTGFLDFVRSKGPGPLFYGRSSGNPEKMHATKGTTNKQGEWIRAQGFKDPRQAPNHAFRHWFLQAGQRLDLAESVIEAITGQSGKSVANRVYRAADIPTKARAIARIADLVL